MKFHSCNKNTFHKSLRILLSVFLISLVAVSAAAQQRSTDKFVIVLDPGHGGKDPGNMGNGLREKNIALQIALKVGEELEKHPDIQVIYTRKTDIFITLKGRAEIANKAKADLFVSIHLNAFGTSTPHGAETYVLGTHRNKDNLDVAMKENSVIYLEDDYEETYDGFDPKSPASYIGMTLMQEEYLDQSILLASKIQTSFTNKLKRYNRGVKKAGFLVLRETYMPSVLVESGFLTNLAEGRYLNSAKGQREMATSIAEGLIQYKNTLNLEVPHHEDIAVDENQIYYKVQISAGTNMLSTIPNNFKGLSNIERMQEGRLYKYFYGSTPDRQQADELLREAKNKGYKEAFIVRFKNGQKI